MIPSAERVAELAISRFGADPARIQSLLDELRQAQRRGETLDFLELLERDHVLIDEQISALRFALDQTQVDPGVVKKNGASAPSDDPFRDLRSLGRYHILRRLGEGGMGSVFLGYDEKEHRQVAIKVLAAEHAAKQATLERFYREAKSGALLNHPNIVRNLDYGQDRATGLHYLVMEFVDGPSAQQLLERFGRLAVGDAVHIALDIARALEHAHSRNIIHRDIKPGNVLIAKSGLAKLADLGLAKRTDETSHITHMRQGFGTPYYMPYEQAMNAKLADARSDIYALGATLYHLVAGEVPFPGMNPLEIMDRKQVGDFAPAQTHNPAVPDELDRLLARMLARDPDERYQTASELIVDLERSNLSAVVPSFVDPLDAYNDPLVRERLTAPPPATQLDLRLRAADDLWYVLAHDRHAQVVKTKMPTAVLKKRLRSGGLASIQVARSPRGPFLPPTEFPELGDAVDRPRPARRRRTQSASPDPWPAGWWLLLLILGLSITTLVILVYLALR